MSLEKGSETKMKKTTDMIGPVYASGDQEKMAVNHFKVKNF